MRSAIRSYGNGKPQPRIVKVVYGMRYPLIAQIFYNGIEAARSFGELGPEVST